MSDWNPKANDIFLKALEAGTPDERRRFAGEACGGDAELLAQVESLTSWSRCTRAWRSRR